MVMIFQCVSCQAPACCKDCFALEAVKCFTLIMLEVSVAVEESLAHSMIQFYMFSVLIKGSYFIITFLTDEPASYSAAPFFSLDISVIVTVVGLIVRILFCWGWISIDQEILNIEMFSCHIVMTHHSNVSI